MFFITQLYFTSICYHFMSFFYHYKIIGKIYSKAFACGSGFILSTSLSKSCSKSVKIFIC